MVDEEGKKPPRRSDSGASKSSGYSTAGLTPVDDKTEEDVFLLCTPSRPVHSSASSDTIASRQEIFVSRGFKSSNSSHGTNNSGDHTSHGAHRSGDNSSFMLPSDFCANQFSKPNIPTFLDDLNTTYLDATTKANLKDEIITYSNMENPNVSASSQESSVEVAMIVQGRYSFGEQIGQLDGSLAHREERMNQITDDDRRNRFEQHEQSMFPEDRLAELSVGIQCSRPDCPLKSCQFGQKVIGSIYAGLQKGLVLQPPVTRACWDHAICCNIHKCYSPFCTDFKHWHWLGFRYPAAVEKLLDKYGEPPKGLIPLGIQPEVTQLTKEEGKTLAALQEDVNFYPEHIMGSFGQVYFGRTHPLNNPQQIAVKMLQSFRLHHVDITNKLKDTEHVSSALLTSFQYQLAARVLLIASKKCDFTLKTYREHTYPSGMQWCGDFSRIMSQVLDANTFLINNHIINHTWDVEHIGCYRRTSGIEIKLFNLSGAVIDSKLKENLQECALKIKEDILPIYWPKEFFEEKVIFPYSVIWMLGLLVFEMASGRRPRENLVHRSKEAMQQHISASPALELSHVTCGSLREIVSTCCEVEPSKRLHLKDLADMVHQNRL